MKAEGNQTKEPSKASLQLPLTAFVLFVEKKQLSWAGGVWKSTEIVSKGDKQS